MSGSSETMARAVNVPPAAVRLAAAMAMFVLKPSSPPRGPPWRVARPKAQAWSMTRQGPAHRWTPSIPAASGCQLVPEASRSMG